MTRLLRDTGGVSAIQFALVAPAFIAIVIAIFETAFVYLAEDGLETAVESAGRLLMTGQAQQARMTAAQFKTAACGALPPYMQCSNLLVDVSTASSYSGADLTSPQINYDNNGNVTNNFNFSPGTQGAIVVVRLMYFWPTVSGPLGFNLANQPGNKRLLIATSVLKSEIY